MKDAITKHLLSALAKVLGVSKTLLDWIIPIVKSQFASSLEKLLPIALVVVAELAVSSLTGSQKKEEAFKRLEEEAKKEGITAGTSILNLVIEMAVAKLRS